MTEPPPPRSAWLPVLVGLAAAVLTAVAAAKPWASAGKSATSPAAAGLSGAGQEPLALALALVALAAWGAVLVTRGRFRLGIVVVGLLGALGVVVTAVVAGDEMTFLLGSREIAGTTDLDVYSPTSPLGAAIDGKTVGDETSYTAPNGNEIAVKIVAAKPFEG